MDLLNTLLADKGIQLSMNQKEQFDLYFQELIKWNSKMNLTAITDEKDVVIKHFYDSLTPGFYFSFEEGLKLCDVGSGAGFPGIPLKILYPQLDLTIVDSLNKRLSFLRSLVEVLHLDGVHLYHDRAETFAHRKDMREQFHVVTARAVANLSVLSEYCLPLVRQKGMFIALKGTKADQEIAAAEGAISKLGGALKNNFLLRLPDDGGERTLIFIEKKGQTPEKFPRKPGLPLKKPL